jgi:hypothetical protein
MAKGRNPYRSGTASYARYRKAALKRKSALAQATAAGQRHPKRAGARSSAQPPLNERCGQSSREKNSDQS